MTDVRTQDAPAPTGEQRPNPRGDFIWYELMTPDPDGAKAFYDAVVGWTIEAEPQFPNGYRMISRSDGNAPAASCRSPTRCSSMAPGRSGSATSGRRCRSQRRSDRAGRRQDADAGVRHSRTSAASRWSPTRMARPST